MKLLISRVEVRSQYNEKKSHFPFPNLLKIQGQEETVKTLGP